MSLLLDIHHAGSGFNCRVWNGGEYACGLEKPTVKEAIFDAVERAPFINKDLAKIHLAQGNGLTCNMCRKHNTKECSFTVNYGCYVPKGK